MLASLLSVAINFHWPYESNKIFEKELRSFALRSLFLTRSHLERNVCVRAHILGHRRFNLL